MELLRKFYENGVSMASMSAMLHRSESSIFSKALDCGFRRHKFCNIQGCNESLGLNNSSGLCASHYWHWYYEKNNESFKLRSRLWRLEHQLRYKEYMRKYASVNSGKIVERMHKWVLRNRERYREHQRRYSMCHRDEHSLRAQLYRERKRGAEGSHTLAEWLEIKSSTNGFCSRCNKFIGVSKLTKDHIKALKLHGSNYAWNLQPLCMPCNSAKGKRIINYLEGWKAFHRNECHDLISEELLCGES